MKAVDVKSRVLENWTEFLMCRGGEGWPEDPRPVGEGREFLCLLILAMYTTCYRGEGHVLHVLSIVTTVVPKILHKSCIQVAQIDKEISTWVPQNHFLLLCASTVMKVVL